MHLPHGKIILHDEEAVVMPLQEEDSPRAERCLPAMSLTSPKPAGTDVEATNHGMLRLSVERIRQRFSLIE